MELKDIKKIKIYSMKEVSEFMDISAQTLRKMIENGRIKALNIAGSGTKPIFGFTAEAVQEYYASIQNTSDGIKNIDKQDLRGDGVERKEESEGQHPVVCGSVLPDQGEGAKISGGNTV